MSLTTRLLFSVALAGLCSPAVHARQVDPVDRVLACRAIEDVEARLACFDSSSAQLAAARQTGEILVVEREDVEAVERDSFGFNLPSLPRFRLSQMLPGDRQHDAVETSGTDESVRIAEATAPAESGAEETPLASPEPAPEEVRVVARDDDGNVDTVTMLIERTRTVGYNTTIFHMANGQVWRQIDDGNVRMPRRGEAYAEIRRGAMTSYLLRINGGGRAIRVRREE